jgi:hypothetical protein
MMERRGTNSDGCWLAAARQLLVIAGRADLGLI